MRYCLLASAGLAAIGLAFAIPATAATPTCICQDQIRLASKNRRPVAHRTLVRHPQRTGAAGSYYDYRSANTLDTQPYTHHWEVAPQGFVSLPPVAMMDGTPVPPGAPPGYGESYQDSYAYGHQAGITIDQQGWTGGVGYTHAHGSGGILRLAQPVSLNGPTYNNFIQSYGGDYQSANQVDAWRQRAFTRSITSSSRTARH